MLVGVSFRFVDNSSGFFGKHKCRKETQFQRNKLCWSDTRQTIQCQQITEIISVGRKYQPHDKLYFHSFCKIEALQNK